MQKIPSGSKISSSGQEQRFFTNPQNIVFAKGSLARGLKLA